MDAKIAARLKEKMTNPIEAYREYGYFQFSDDGEGARLRESREHLHELGLDDDKDVSEIDEIVIEAAIANDYVNPDLIDDQDVPLKNWWWHLGKIRTKTYPAELLSVPLQAIYADTQK